MKKVSLLLITSACLLIFIALCMGTQLDYYGPFAEGELPESLNQSEAMVFLGPYCYIGKIEVMTPALIGFNCTKAGLANAPEANYDLYPDGAKMLFGVEDIVLIMVLTPPQ
jgi:hypothetical protein